LIDFFELKKEIMKKTILILLTLVSWASYAQDTKPSTLKPENQRDRFTCQTVEVSSGDKKMFLKENVKIETENLILMADSAVFDEENQTLIAYGTKKFTFNGEAVISKNAKNTVRYKLNDKTIYVE
jgi:lipopolysaccharide assembly outer membrane protein LptD (OstA)